MEDLRERYERLNREFQAYQGFAELQLQKLSNRNMKLERDINALANIVEISKYINSFISDKNLIGMINDMILGLFGVARSSVFLLEDDDYKIKSTNLQVKKEQLSSYERERLGEGKSFIVNSVEPLRSYKEQDLDVRSAMGMPIKIRDKIIGFILVEHRVYNALDLEHEKFLNSIANQIAVAIENSRLYREIQETAKKDPLMGIYNRRYFFTLVDQLLAENPYREYAIVMLDIDNFKKFNDSYGHQFGDEVLIKTAQVIKNNIGSKDILARYGGEELIIYINNAKDIMEVYNKIETIRGCIEKNLVIRDNIAKCVTASFGIGYAQRDGKNINEVIKMADKHLYRSKAMGKNMVLISDFIK